MNSECSSKAQRLSSNIISTLPQTIIENILCLLPIQEAARTSILSREWRYKWTTIPKLVFFKSITSERKTKEKLPYDTTSARKKTDHSCNHNPFNAIHQVLLMRQGPIHEFTVSTNGNAHYFELDQTIFHLSRNHTVKKLRLMLNETYKLPLCAYSLHQLTHLDLTNVDLNHQPISIGFGSLRSIYFIHVDIRTKALLHLLSNCPSLKSFTLFTEVDIGSKDCTIIELFDCLPVIEHLTIWGDYVHPWLDLDSIPEELPTALIHLKSFSFYEMCFADYHGLTFLAVLIKCSPNLEKLELEIHVGHSYCYENEMCCGKLEEYSDIWLEHLEELEIRFFSNLKREMEFVKFILARSPKLKKVSIHSSVEKDEESDMLKALLQAPRVSPVQIVVK